LNTDFASLWQQASLAHEAGDHARARQICEHLLGDPASALRARWLLANIALGGRDIAAALQHAKQAASIASASPVHQRVAISRLMITMGEFEGASHLLDRMRAEAPADGVLIAIGEQLSMLERHQEALDTLRLAQATGLRHPMLSFLLSSTFRYLGDFEGAIEAAEETLRLQPHFAHAHWAMSQLGGMDGAPHRIDRIRLSIAALRDRHDASTPQMQSALSMLWHALFRELDAMDDRRAAWPALSRGLEIKHAVQPHDRVAEDGLFDRLSETYTEDFVRPRPLRAERTTTPVFVVGLPRTGTTLVERIITNHSQVAACGELNELQLLTKRRTGRWSQEFIDAEIVDRLATADLDTLGEEYLDSVAWRARGARFMVDKHQSNFLLAGLILRCLPEARLIHVRRDPVDACFSNLKEPFAAHAYGYSNTQRDVANHYRNYDRLMRRLHGVAGERILEVRYEELVRDREGQARRMLDFIGLPMESGLEDISGNRTPVASASSVQVRAPIHDRNIGSWRRYAAELGELQQALGGS